MNYVYVKKIKDGIDFGTIDIPVKHLEETLKRNPEWKVIDTKYLEEEKIQPPEFIANLQKFGIVECPICGREFKNIGGLTLHKRIHK